MRRIELARNDVELFDSDIVPQLADFFLRHRDAFRQMKIDQGKEFWSRFVISFRSFSTNMGTIKDIPYLCDQMNVIYDQGFILVHEEFVEGKPNAACNFITDIIMVARNQNNFPSLEGKQTRAHDLFFIKETREVFRRFYGSPENNLSYMKVYVLSPVLIKFGGAVCVCLKRWLQAREMDPCDTSYWTPPNTVIRTKVKPFHKMCSFCFDTLIYACFRERVHGDSKGPKYLSWKYGDPRKNDPLNPLYNVDADSTTDWRDGLTFTAFNAFFQYVQLTCNSHHVIAECDCDDFMASSNIEANFSKIFIIEATEKKSTAGRLAYLSEKARKKRIQLKQTKEVASKESGAKTAENGLECSSKSNSTATVAAFLENDPEFESDDDQSLIRSIIPVNENAVDLCEVMHIVDEVTGTSEIIITTTHHDMIAADFTDLYTYYPSEFPIAEKFLIEKFDNSLPKNFKWTENGNVSVTFDYTAEESAKTKKPTNFRLVMKCREECRLKWLMIFMIDYVNKRKKRDSLGWTLTSDDILVNMLPNLRSTIWEGVCIRIQQGLDTADLLPDSTGHRPYIRSSRTGSQIFGKNPVRGDTWTRLSDGSLKLVDPSHDNPLALSKLKQMVEKLHINLKITYCRQRSLVSKFLYPLISKNILSLTLSFHFGRDAQRRVVCEFSKMCNAVISNLARVLVETPSIDPMPICHRAADECIAKLRKVIYELKQLPGSNGACKPSTGAQASIMETLHDYCKGMAVRIQYSEEIDTDEEDAACEAVVDTLCGPSPSSTATNSASKPSEQNIKSTGRPACVHITHNRCPKHSHLCGKCHKPKMPCPKHGSSCSEPSAETVSGDTQKVTVTKTLPAVDARKGSLPPTSNAETSSTSTGNKKPEVLKVTTETISLSVNKRAQSACEPLLDSSLANNCATQPPRIQIRVSVKKVTEKKNLDSGDLGRNGMTSACKPSAWHDAVQGPANMSSANIFSASQLSEKNADKKKDSNKDALHNIDAKSPRKLKNVISEEKAQNVPAKKVTRKTTKSAGGTSNYSTANNMNRNTSLGSNPCFEFDVEYDPDVEREKQKWMERTMCELGLTNPLDLITALAGGREMLGENVNFIEDGRAVHERIVRKSGMMNTNSTMNRSEIRKETTSSGKKKKRGKKGRSSNSSAPITPLNVSDPQDGGSDKQASGACVKTQGTHNEDERKAGMVVKMEEGTELKQNNAEQKQNGTEQKHGVAEKKQEGSEKKQEGTEKKQEGTEQKQNGTEQKHGVAEKKQEGTEQKQNGTEQKHGVAEKKQEGTEKKQEGTEKKQEGTKQKQNGTEQKHGVAEKKQEGTEQKQNGTEQNHGVAEKKHEGTEQKQNGTEQKHGVGEKKHEGTEKKQKGTERKKKSSEPKQKDTEKKHEGVEQKLKTCANCGEVEPKPKTFKKCQKCRIEEVGNSRYYCGRDCQVSDWVGRHKDEHRSKSFP